MFCSILFYYRNFIVLLKLHIKDLSMNREYKKMKDICARTDTRVLEFNLEETRKTYDNSYSYVNRDRNKTNPANATVRKGKKKKFCILV